MSITAPNKPARQTKGTPPEAPKAVAPAEGKKKTGNTSKPSSSDYVALNFSVDAEFRKEFRLLAATRDMPMTDLLKEGFELLKAKYGIR